MGTVASSDTATHAITGKVSTARVRFDCSVILVAAILIRLVFALASVAETGSDFILNATPDTRNYVALAMDLRHGTDAVEFLRIVFPPGYPVFLCFVFTLFGVSGFAVILIQILLSSLTCVLTYLLALRLLQHRVLALIGGVWMICSYTAITLSAIVLSETCYVALIVSGLYLFLTAFQDNSRTRFLLSGVLTSAAIMTRAVAQYWPLVLLLIALPHILRLGRKRRLRIGVPKRSAVLGAAFSIVISVAAVAAWSYHNRVVYGIAAMTSGASGGLANVAALTVERKDGRPYREVRADWHRQYAEENGLETISATDLHRADSEAATRIFRQSPLGMVESWLILVWENMRSPNQVARLLFPESSGPVIHFEYFLKRNYAAEIAIVLAGLGLVALVFTGRFLALYVLGLFYIYHAAVIGFTRWQGSRLFVPAEVPTAILAAAAVGGGYWVVRSLVRRVARSRASKKRPPDNH